MATDMGRGIIAPDTGDNISSTGVNEMRTLAATAATAVATSEGNLKALEIAPLSARVKELEDLPRLPDNTNLNALTTPFADTKTWRASKSNGIVNAPADAPNTQAKFSQFRTSSSDATQRWESLSGRQWVRYQFAGVWSEWANDNPSWGDFVPAGADLNTYLTPGPYRVSAGTQPLNSAFPGESYTLEVLQMGRDWNMQRATNEDGVVRFRPGVGSTGTAWRPWKTPGGGTGTGGEARTPMEVTGEWTSSTGEADYLTSLGQHQAINVFEVGRSVENRPIQGIRIGDAIDPWGTPKPTILFMATQHGDELGPREGALLFARDLAQAKTFALFDLCVLIVPTVNVDKLDVSRSNANGVNINRDWVDLAQPETQAIMTLFAQYPIVATVDAHSFGYAREVSLRETRNANATTAVVAQSQRLYDATYSMLEDEGHAVRQYGDPDGEPTQGTAVNELSTTTGTATLLLEIPSHRNSYGRYSPPPSWQAEMARLVFHEVLQVVWRERADFTASHAGGNL